MKHRKLRIAWSVTWGIVAVLLVALWVRSYWIADGVNYCDSLNSVGAVVSETGTVRILYQRGTPDIEGVGWKYISRNANSDYAGPRWGWYRYDPDKAASWIRYHGRNGPPLEFYSYIVCPYWLLFSLSAFAASMSAWVPALCFRFSLRTLLIATTLVAIVLGLMVWLW